MSKFEDHWAKARDTKDCAVFDHAVKAMLNSASNPQQYNAALNLSLNGKTPLIIDVLDQVTGIKKED